MEVCVEIRPETEVEVKKPRKRKRPECADENCTTRPLFNYNEEKMGKFCAKHKMPKMKDVVSPTCVKETCNTRPQFNFIGMKRGLFCAKHALNGMMDIRNPICKFDTCTTRPHFNYIGQKKGLYCAVHALHTMQDVVHDTCEFDDCNIRPSYNEFGKKRGLYCMKHALPDMVDLENKTCKHETCDTRPHFNYLGQKRGLYCATHALPNMVDTINPRCKHDTCNTRINPKYRGFCFQHFQEEFPDEPITRNWKTKELAMGRYISEQFPNLEWLDDKRIPGGTSGKRGDKMTDIKSHLIIIECDENRHLSYKTEMERMQELSDDVNNRPIIFIRFNPDGYSVNGKKNRSCWGKTKEGFVRVTRQKEWDIRLEYLRQEIVHAIHTVPTEPITEKYLFYDSTFDESLLCQPCNE